MSISNDYKESSFERLKDLLIRKSDFCQFKSDNDINEENDCIDYFDMEMYNALKTPIERMRYFVLYDLKKVEELYEVIGQILDDINSSLNDDYYVLLKTLLKLFQYDSDSIPSSLQIYEILKKTILEEELTNDSKKLIIFYYSNFGLLYSLEDLIELIEFSLQIDDKRRTSIWSLELRMILIYNYTLPKKLFSKMIFLFENLRTVDKYLITQIILAMILSKNENNHKTINIIFIEHSKLIKEILFCCAEGENVFTITAILHSIEKYSNFDFDKELIDFCNEVKKK